MSAHPATAESYALAEGPLWDATRNRLLWVDIPAGAVLTGRLDQKITAEERHTLPGTVGAVVVAADGTLLVAGQERLHTIDPDGTVCDGPRVVPAGARSRLNDGAVDPDGRFLVGTLSFEPDSDQEQLVRLEPDGTLTVLDADLQLSNGLAWSPDGATLYSTDTGRRTIFARAYGDEPGPRRPHLVLDDGHPDGIATDADNHLWVAVWGGHEVRRYAPTGELIERLEIDAPNVSSVAFAGNDLRTLVITTATEGLDVTQRAAHPDSGRLFTTRVDVPGVPTTAWSRTAGFSQPAPSRST